MSKKRKAPAPYEANENVDKRSTDKVLYVPEDVSILQDKESALKASKSFNFIIDEKNSRCKSLSWLRNESTLILGQALQLYNIFANKAAYRNERLNEAIKELEEKLGRAEAERDDSRKEKDEAIAALAKLNEKVLNLSSSLLLEKEEMID